MTSKELKYLTSHTKGLQKYAGKHIAIVGDQVVSVGDTYMGAFKKAKEKTGKKPLVTFIPRRKVVMYNCNVPYLLGRASVFERFKVCFDDKEGVLTFHSNNYPHGD